MSKMTITMMSAVLAMAMALAACGGSQHRSAASGPVRCGQITCSHGHVGEACVSVGFPGIIAQAGAGKLICDSRQVTQPQPVSSRQKVLGGHCTDAYGDPGIWVEDTPNHLICDADGPVTPQPQPPTPTLTGTCVLGFLAGYEQDTSGFYSGGGFYPDTLAGMRDAAKAETTIDGYSAGPVNGAQVRITDSGVGATLSGFTMEIDDSQGTLIVQHQITEGYQLPQFLAPGESAPFLIDFAALPGTVNVSVKTYLGSSCTATGWH
jgi:hypothetical protein